MDWLLLLLLLLLFSIVVVMGEIGDCDYVWVDVDCILRFLGDRIVIFLKRFRKPQKYIFDLLTIILDFGSSIYYFLIFIYKY